MGLERREVNSHLGEYLAACRSEYVRCLPQLRTPTIGGCRGRSVDSIGTDERAAFEEAGEYIDTEPTCEVVIAGSRDAKSLPCLYCT